MQCKLALMIVAGSGSVLPQQQPQQGQGQCAVAAAAMQADSDLVIDTEARLYLAFAFLMYCSKQQSLERVSNAGSHGYLNVTFARGAPTGFHLSLTSFAAVSWKYIVLTYLDGATVPIEQQHQDPTSVLGPVASAVRTTFNNNKTLCTLPCRNIKAVARSEHTASATLDV